VTTRESGTGLGLAIVQRIAEDHGGYIRLMENADGAQGATVVFALPVAEVAISPEYIVPTDPDTLTYANLPPYKKDNAS